MAEYKVTPRELFGEPDSSYINPETGETAYQYTGTIPGLGESIKGVGSLLEMIGIKPGGVQERTPDNPKNPTKQPAYDVSGLENPSNTNQSELARKDKTMVNIPGSPQAEFTSYSPEDSNQMSQLWGKHYQTEEDPTKMAKFAEEMGAPRNQAIRDIVDKVSGVYGENETGMPKEDFENLLYHTGFHESGAIGGTPRASQGYLDSTTGEWVTQGPARSYWQVEPSTLRDLVTARQGDMSTNPTSAYWGPEARKRTGHSAEDLYGMTDEQLSQLLEANPSLGAVAAGGKYVKSMRNAPVNQVMDANEELESIWNIPE